MENWHKPKDTGYYVLGCSDEDCPACKLVELKWRGNGGIAAREKRLAQKRELKKQQEEVKE